MTAKKKKPQRARLTEKQEKFALLVVEGAGYSEAYRKVYNTSSKSRNAVNVEAFNLANKDIVAAHIKKLKNDLEAENLWSRKMSVQALMNAYKRAEQEGQTGSMVSAVRELNNMHGFNEPAKVDITSQGESLAPRIIEIVAPSDK